MTVTELIAQIEADLGRRGTRPVVDECDIYEALGFKVDRERWRYLERSRWRSVLRSLWSVDDALLLLQKHISNGNELRRACQRACGAAEAPPGHTFGPILAALLTIEALRAAEAKEAA